MAIRCKTPAEIAAMREAGRIVARTYQHLEPFIRPGITTAELDRIAERFIRAQGATPAYKGYGAAPATRDRPAQPAFPATICVAVNDTIVHGIPSQKERLREGDIVGIDVGVRYRGWVGDACVTYAVGEVDERSRRLLQVTRECMELGIAQARPGNRLGHIGAAIQQHAEANGFSVVREYIGHGVGSRLHEDPALYHHTYNGFDETVLKPGMTFTIEPMVNVGKPDARVMKDRWTVKTADGSRSAQFEHTIAITTGDPLILTLP